MIKSPWWVALAVLLEFSQTSAEYQTSMYTDQISSGKDISKLLQSTKKEAFFMSLAKKRKVLN